ncbi:unnamed protein product [Gordionus sp. m RMFG-2023]
MNLNCKKSNDILHSNKGLKYISYNYPYKLVLLTTHNQLSQKRCFWAWLNVVWNRYDKKRVKEVGPDQAAAEWLLRCGASLKFKNQSAWDSDYNSIVSENSKDVGRRIEAIDTNESCVNEMGFGYLDGLQSLNSISLRYSPYVTDACLTKISKYSANTLETLIIDNCYEISEWGLLNNLPPLKLLKKLELKNLPLIDNKAIKEKLKEVLPKSCEVVIIASTTPDKIPKK